MEEKMLTMKQESEIKEKAQKIKEEKKLRKIYPMVVFGEAGDEKEVSFLGMHTIMRKARLMIRRWKSIRDLLPHLVVALLSAVIPVSMLRYQRLI